MIIEKETDNSNPITHKTVYSYVLRCPTDNHVVSCNSNVRITRGKSEPKGKIYCPICKNEFYAPINKQMIYVWKKCEVCAGKGYIIDINKRKDACYHCKEFREIGGVGRWLVPKPNSVWICYNCNPRSTFSLDLKKLNVKKWKFYEYIDDDEIHKLTF